MTTFYKIFTASLGKLTISTDGHFLTSLHIEGDRYFRDIPSDWVKSELHPLLRQGESEVLEYLSGNRNNFTVPFSAKGTSFQQKVWTEISNIPYGKTVSYKTIAENLGAPNASRAVGTAVGKNPLCIIIPCHRVLTEKGTLGGYVAGLEVKRNLLRIESPQNVMNIALYG